MSELQDLQRLLKDLPPGPLDNTHSQEARLLLQGCWSSLEGRGENATEWDKIHRAEDLCLAAEGCITFQLERHRPTVNGSTRADVHHWQVNLNSGKAKIVKTSVRQLYKASARWDHKEAAQEIIAAACSGKQHRGIKWLREGQDFRVVLSKVVPSGCPRTTADRNKRLRKCLEDTLAPLGWCTYPNSNHCCFRREGNNQQEKA